MGRESIVSARGESVSDDVKVGRDDMFHAQPRLVLGGRPVEETDPDAVVCIAKVLDVQVEVLQMREGGGPVMVWRFGECPFWVVAGGEEGDERDEGEVFGCYAGDV